MLECSTIKDIVLREACKLLNNGEIIIIEINDFQEIMNKRHLIFKRED